ncbi:hypothetical protein TanjilG_06132 [Lupinus angustifolius]|uniref:Uncharacterized protein n=1 Tax=Lupinus angustifolius TaxID=3871 RepID=A0A394DEA8_LUPAN|nr:hypothetical protein TanjilG_06132 [Lupinus angustifolius]
MQAPARPSSCTRLHQIQHPSLGSKSPAPVCIAVPVHPLISPFNLKVQTSAHTLRHTKSIPFMPLILCSQVHHKSITSSLPATKDAHVA